MASSTSSTCAMKIAAAGSTPTTEPWRAASCGSTAALRRRRTLLPIDRSFPGCNRTTRNRIAPRASGRRGFHVVDMERRWASGSVGPRPIHSNPTLTAMVYVPKSDGRSMTAVTLNNIRSLTRRTTIFVCWPNSFTLDVDGDGQFDIVQVDSPNHFVPRRQTTAAPDLLRTVTDGLGKVGVSSRTHPRSTGSLPMQRGHPLRRATAVGRLARSTSTMGSAQRYRAHTPLRDARDQQEER